MLSPPDVLRLAQLYAVAERVSLSTLGRRACGNNRVFLRLVQGQGANVKTLQRVETFFRATWPDSATWPVDIVPGPVYRRRSPRRVDDAADGDVL